MAGIKANITILNVSIGGTMTPVGCITDIGSSSSSNTIDSSCLSSTSAETTAGLPSAGELSLSLNLLTADAGQAEMRRLFEQAEEGTFEIILSDGQNLAFAGTPTSWDLSVAVDSIVTVSSNVTLTGSIIWS